MKVRSLSDQALLVLVGILEDAKERSGSLEFPERVRAPRVLNILCHLAQGYEDERVRRVY